MNAVQLEIMGTTYYPDLLRIHVYLFNNLNFPCLIKNKIVSLYLGEKGLKGLRKGQEPAHRVDFFTLLESKGREMSWKLLNLYF